MDAPTNTDSAPKKRRAESDAQDKHGGNKKVKVSYFFVCNHKQFQIDGVLASQSHSRPAAAGYPMALTQARAKQIGTCPAEADRILG
jgi:hypothetical protein